jgi:2-dehydro-3-deoxyglucarate aldolase
MGAAGYDWIAVDLEHGRFSEKELSSVFRAIGQRGTLPMARVGAVTVLNVKAALESGAAGVILPMIATAAQLRAAISWAKFPPAGSRGVGYSRANLFGQDFEGYKAFDPLVIAQIESHAAIRDIDEVLSVPGLDAAMIGPYDLSASMGLTGQFDHPDFRAAIAAFAASCRHNNIASGIHVVTPTETALGAAIAEGHRFVAYATDAIFLWNSAKRPGIA